MSDRMEMRIDTDIVIEDLTPAGVDALLAERGRTHGDWAQTARISQGMKEALRGSGRWDALPDGVRESLDMVCVKMARIVSGDWSEPDHARDIVGYIRLMEGSGE